MRRASQPMGRQDVARRRSRRIEWAIASRTRLRMTDEASSGRRSVRLRTASRRRPRRRRAPHVRAHTELDARDCLGRTRTGGWSGRPRCRSSCSRRGAVGRRVSTRRGLLRPERAWPRSFPCRLRRAACARPRPRFGRRRARPPPAGTGRGGAALLRLPRAAPGRSTRRRRCDAWAPTGARDPKSGPRRLHDPCTPRRRWTPDQPPGDARRSCPSSTRSIR